MRVIKVTVSAFGSYQGVVEFPLEELGTEGLYLIYGNTGSGKTTLFDAICFALYGEASGKDRKPKEFRCEYANAKTDTKVVVVFEVYGKRYEVSRWYTMDKTRTIVKDSKAELKLLDQDPDAPQPALVKVGEVDDFVEDLLKVDHDQFKQIAMVAQGEFQKVLLASTTDRSAIFTTMFQTQKYSEIQAEIKKDYEEVEANRKENETRIRDSLARLELFGEETEEEKTLYQELKSKKVELEESGNELNTLLQGQQGALTQLGTQKQEVKRLLAETQEYITKLDTVEGLLSQKKVAETNLSAQEQVLTVAEKKREDTLVLQGQIEENKEKLLKIKDLLEICQVVAEEQKEVTTLQLEVKALELDEVKGLQLKENKEREEQEGKDWLATNEKIGEEILTLRQKVETEKQVMASFEKLEHDFNAMKQKEKKKNTLEKKYDALKKMWEQGHQDYTRQMSLFLDEQAGILAEQLTEGEACLVCGSTHHPEPAKKTSPTCTSEELETMREAVEAQEKEVRTLSDQLGNMKNELSALMGGVLTQGQSLLQTEDLEEISQGLFQKSENSALVADEAKLKVLEGLEKEKEKKEEGLKRMIQEKEAVTLDIQRIAVEKEKKNGILSEKISSLEKKKSKLDEETEHTLTGKKVALMNKNKEYETACTQAENEWSNAKEGLASCKGSLDGVLESLKQIEISKEEFDHKDECLKKEKEYQTLVATFETRETGMLTVVRNNEKIHNEVTDFVDKRVEIAQRKEWLEPLHQAANGKIKLETFVQSYYFDLVLAEANRVYSSMNNNKYLMLRDEEKDGNAAVGLGVKIYEQETGKMRRARTLSGGESFQASLSLALGFSQAVAQEAEASPIKSLFLDEGFGSLDGDSLQIAIGTLLDLAQKGRMVGIISHVEELKNAITKRILVEKTPRGSTVTFQGIDSTTT